MWARKQKSGARMEKLGLVFVENVWKLRMRRKCAWQCARMVKLGLVSMKYMQKFEKNEKEMCMTMCQNGKVRTSVCEQFAGSYNKMER
jgi:hypothetical protein